MFWLDSTLKIDPIVYPPEHPRAVYLAYGGCPVYDLIKHAKFQLNRFKRYDGSHAYSLFVTQAGDLGCFKCPSCAKSHI